MKILLVGNYLPDKQKSMSAFAKMMEQTLIAYGHDVKLLTPSVRLVPKGKALVGIWKWVAYLDKYLLFPFELKKVASQYDLVHICDHSNAVYTLFLKRFSTIVTCHDVLAIEYARNLVPNVKVGFSGKVLQWFIFKGLNCASIVVCDSAYTKTHLINLGWYGKDISIAWLALNEDFAPTDQYQVKNTKFNLGLQPDDLYFIHVGSDLPRKNRFFVLKTFNEVKKMSPDNKLKLVFVGPRFSNVMHEYIKLMNLSDSVLSIQDAPHNELKALYSGALASIFPSLQEGFGWPIIEAQACGCPVFTSNLAPMTEVGGDGAIYIDPYDEVSSATIIHESLSNLEMVRKSGFRNVRKFSKQNMMKTYLAAYERAVDVAQ